MSSRGGVQLEVNRRRLTALYPTLLGLHWRETNGPRTLRMVSTPLAGFSRLCDPACGWRFPPGSPAKAAVFAGSPASLILWRGVFISRKPQAGGCRRRHGRASLPSLGNYCPTFDLLVDQRPEFLHFILGKELQPDDLQAAVRSQFIDHAAATVLVRVISHLSSAGLLSQTHCGGPP